MNKSITWRVFLLVAGVCGSRERDCGICPLGWKRASAGREQRAESVISLGEACHLDTGASPNTRGDGGRRRGLENRGFMKRCTYVNCSTYTTNLKFLYGVWCTDVWDTLRIKNSIHLWHAVRWSLSKCTWLLSTTVDKYMLNLQSVGNPSLQNSGFLTRHFKVNCFYVALERIFKNANKKYITRTIYCKLLHTISVLFSLITFLAVGEMLIEIRASHIPVIFLHTAYSIVSKW